MTRTLVALASSCLCLAAVAPAQEPTVDTLAVKAHTYFLSDDLLRGRATGTEGAELAALYIVSQCRRIGLEPVGDTYRLPVPLEEARVLAGTELTLQGPGGASRFASPADFLLNVGRRATLVDFAGRLVFVGSAEQVTSGALRNIDLTGRVAVTLGAFRGAAADSVEARGATGMIHLVGNDETYALYVRSRGDTRLYHEDPAIESSFLPSIPSVLAGPRLAQALLQGLRRPDSGAAGPEVLPGGVRVHVELARKRVHAANVACVLRGARPSARDTAIALSAHYDHLGVSTPDAVGDSIYNGFSDNAAGVGMVLAVGEALARSVPPPAHSILLLFFTGEERGLLGSDAYVAHPAWALARTAALVNLDAGAPPGRPTSWRLAGTDSTGLGALALPIAADHGWTASTSPATANSDYYPFHRSGVPAVFIIPGPDPYEGLSADSSKALRARWDHYHQPADEWSDRFPFGGLGRNAQYALEIVRRVDSGGVPLGSP